MSISTTRHHTQSISDPLSPQIFRESNPRTPHCPPPTELFTGEIEFVCLCHPLSPAGAVFSAEELEDALEIALKAAGGVHRQLLELGLSCEDLGKTSVHLSVQAQEAPAEVRQRSVALVKGCSSMRGEDSPGGRGRGELVLVVRTHVGD